MGLVAVLLAPSGCDRAIPAGSVTHSDSAGIDIVVWDGQTRPLTVSAERSFTLGGEDEGPQSFYELYRRSVSISDDGLIGILNRHAHEVAVFDSSGVHLFSRGSEGEGPGEVAFPSSLIVRTGGAVDIFDFRKRAMVRFDPEGRVLDQTPVSVPYNGYLGMTALPGGGQLLMSQTAPRGAGDVVRRVLRITESDTVQLGPSTSTPAVQVRYVSCAMRLTLPPLFASEIRWASNGHRTAVVPDESWSILIHDGPDLSRIIRAAIEAEAVTPAVVARELGEGERWGGGGRECVVPPSEVIEARGHAPYLPLIEAVAVGPDGAIWLRRRNPEGEGLIVDVFSSEGEYVGSAPSANLPFPVSFLPDGRVATIERDDFDIDRLVVYRVHFTPGG